MYNPTLPFGGLGLTTPSGGIQNGPIKVTGIDGARAYPVIPSTTIVLFDANEDYFYLKTTDAVGYQTIRTFRFTEVKDEPQSNQYVTVEEFNKFKEEILNGEQYIRKQPNASKSGKQHSTDKVHDGSGKRVGESGTNNAGPSFSESSV